MQAMLGPTTAHQQTMHQESGHRDGAEPAPMTPAERIVLTIAVLNCGLDLLDGFVRTSLAGCARGAFRGQHDPRQEAPLSQKERTAGAA
jgi:hypothetical protein